MALLKVDPERLKVINLWAGPGAGKSTTAAGLFNLMKIRGYNVELVTEFAKEMVYEGRLRGWRANSFKSSQSRTRGSAASKAKSRGPSPTVRSR